MLNQSIFFPSARRSVGCVYFLLLTFWSLNGGIYIVALFGATASFQDETPTPSQSRLLERIDDLKDELAKQQRVLGSRHPTVRELQVELQVRLKYIDRELDLISAKIFPLEIDLAKAQLKFAANHPEVRSLRQQILLWQKYAQQERIGSDELYRLDTNLEELRIQLSLLANLGGRHPDIIELRKEIAKLQMDRNVLGLQEECERQKLHIWKSEVDRLIADRAGQAGLTVEEWLTEKTREMGMSREQYRLDFVWQELALRKLADSKKPMTDRKLQGVVDQYRKSQARDH